MRSKETTPSKETGKEDVFEMSNAAIIVCLIGIAIAIILNYKFDISVGVTGIAFAYIVGCFMLKMSMKEVVALWPSAAFQIMSIALFFGFPLCNGTMEIFAQHLLYRTRKAPWLIAFALYGIVIILTMMGCSPPAANVLVGVMGFSIGLPAGLHPMIIIWGIVIGSILGACVPWGNNGIIIKSSIVEAGYEAQANAWTWRCFFAMFVVTTIILLILFFIFKGHKIKPFDVEKPPAFNAKQRTSLIMICIMVLFLVIPGFLLKLMPGSELLSFLTSRLDVQGLSAIGFVICALMNLAEPKEVVKKVPWAVILLVGGMGMLIAVATKAGVIDLLASWLNSSVPSFLKVPFMALLAGFLSIFTAAIPTVVPMLYPMVSGIVAGGSIKAITVFIGILLGASYTACSPFSSGGAVVMSTCSDSEVRSKLMNYQLILAVCVLIGLTLVSMSGVLGIF